MVKDYTKGGIIVSAFLRTEKDKNGIMKTYLSYAK